MICLETMVVKLSSIPFRERCVLYHKHYFRYATQRTASPKHILLAFRKGSAILSLWRGTVSGNPPSMRRSFGAPANAPFRAEMPRRIPRVPRNSIPAAAPACGLLPTEAEVVRPVFGDARNAAWHSVRMSRHGRTRPCERIPADRGALTNAARRVGPLNRAHHRSDCQLLHIIAIMAVFQIFNE